MSKKSRLYKKQTRILNRILKSPEVLSAFHMAMQHLYIYGELTNNDIDNIIKYNLA